MVLFNLEVSFFSYSTLAMSDFFRNARDVTIAGGSFNHVERDQHNYYYNSRTTVVQVERTTMWMEFDEVSGPAERGFRS